MAQALISASRDLPSDGVRSFIERAAMRFGGIDAREAARLSRKIVDPLTAFTPLGMADEAVEGARTNAAALRRGEYAPALGGPAVAMAALAAFPGGRAAKVAADLPMDAASRMARAKKSGFTRDVYHGTNSDVTKFSRIDGGNMMGDAVYVAENPKAASAYATGNVNRITPAGDAGPNVMPLKAAVKRPFDITAPATEKDWQAIRKGLVAQGVASADIRDVRKMLLDRHRQRRFDGGATNQDLYEAVAYMVPDSSIEMFNNAAKFGGFDAIRFPASMTGDGQSGHYLAIFDPKNLRSRSAAFDPAKRNSANLMAGVSGATAVGSALIDHLPTTDEIRAQRQQQRVY